MARPWLLVVALAGALGACGSMNAGSGEDLVTGADVGAPADSAGQDASSATPDLSVPSDLSVSPPDVAVGSPDLTPTFDAAAVDLTPSVDLLALPDQTELPDLTSLSDLTSPPDLTPLPDLAPSCSDVTKNGAETDTDCGGPSCGPCGDGKTCAVAADCTSGTCYAGKCGPRQWTVAATGSNLLIQGDGWKDVPGLTLQPTLNSASIVQMRWVGTLRYAATTGACRVGMRFVVDSVPTGDATWGNARMNQNGSVRWHEFFAAEIAVPLAAGAHTVKAQMTTSSSNAACYLQGDGGMAYDGSRLALTAYDPVEAWYAESTAELTLGPESAWTDIPGVATSNLFLAGDRRVLVSLQGTAMPSGNFSNPSSHCAFRLVVDGVARGNASHGQTISVVSQPAGLEQPAVLKDAVDLTAGFHSVTAQMRNSSTGGGCVANSKFFNPVSTRFHMLTTAHAPTSLNQMVESSGGSVVLGSVSAWFSVPGMAKSFSLPAPGHVQFDLYGTQRTITGSGHCAYRYVLDGAPLGDANHGQAINVGDGAASWWNGMGLLEGVDLQKGAHTIDFQVRNSGTTGDCGVNGDAETYGRVRMHLLHM